MNKFIVEENTLQSIYEYLMSRPMVEVESLVNKIRASKPLEESKQEE